jgi:hypothetical protein
MGCPSAPLLDDPKAADGEVPDSEAELDHPRLMENQLRNWLRSRSSVEALGHIADRPSASPHIRLG